MPSTARTFRVFVSSTFADLRAERDVLATQVFPRLATYCRERGAHFQAIDLRWGVSEEAALDQQAMAVCLAEVERCRALSPRLNFIALLGDRYGWLPPAAHIPDAEFGTLLAALPAEQRAPLLRWYRRDGNAVPPVWDLQPRTGPYRNPERWGPVEASLQAALASAAPALAVERRLAYGASAVEQEIAAGAYPMAAAGEPVFAFLRTLTGVPEDGPADAYVERDPDRRAQIERLKAELRRRLPHGVWDYDTPWEGAAPGAAHLAALARDVHDALAAVIADELERGEEALPDERERHSHRAFAHRLLAAPADLHVDASTGDDAFVGRERALRRIEDYVEQGPPQPLGIFGAAGIGKSTLMARAAQRARERWPDARVVVRFIGATPASSDGATLLDGLCRELAQAEGQDYSSNREYADLVREFWVQLEDAREERPLLIFLDALDQLDDPQARRLTWLPATLPEHVRIVVSTLPQECLDLLRERGVALEELDAMPRSEGELLLDRWLARSGRTLRDDQRAEVLDRFAGSGRPLFLRLAFSQVVRSASYDEPLELAVDTPGIIRDVFARLGHADQHGRLLVDRVVANLAASRSGLAEDELLDVLSADEDVMREVRNRTNVAWRDGLDRLPSVLWSRLSLDLEPYLSERLADGGTVTGFYHRQLREVAVADFLGGGAGRDRHRALAGEFRRRADRDGDGTWRGGYARGLRELPYHLTAADRWDELYQTLTDFVFLERKATDVERVGEPVGERDTATHRGVLLLRDDFQRALERWPQSAADGRGVLEQLVRALRLDANTLVERPDLLFSQLVNRLRWSLGPVAKILATATARRAADDPRWWLRLTAPFAESTALLASIQAHERASACAISPDGAFIVSGSWGRTVKIWDAASGDLLSVLPDHGFKVNAVAVGPDNSLVVSVDEEGTLRAWTWDGTQAHQIAERIGHQGEVLGCAVSADGRFVVTTGSDGALLRWPIGTLAPKEVFRDPEVPLRTCAISPDSKRIVAGDDKGVVRLWRVSDASDTLEVMRTGHGMPVESCAISPDGQLIATADRDGTIRFSDMGLEPQGEDIAFPYSWGKSCAFSPDGRLLVGSGSRGIVRIWDVASRAEHATLVGHAGQVHSSRFSPDGRVVVSCGVDGTLKLWDVASASDGPAVSRQGGAVVAVSVSADGARVATADMDGDVRMRDGATGAELLALNTCQGFCQDAAISRDGNLVVTADSDGALEVWPLDDPDGRVGPLHRLPHPGISSCATGAAGTAVSGGGDGRVQAWHAATAKHLWEADAQATIYSCRVSPDGSILVSSGEDGRHWVWDLRSGEQIAVLKGHTGRVWDCAISPDGRLVASAGEDGSVRLWYRSADGRVLGHHAGPGLSTAFSPDGSLVLSASADHRLGVWDAASGRHRTWLIGHGAPVRSCTVTRDGSAVVSAGDDNMLRVWDLQSGAEHTVLRLQGRPGVVAPLAAPRSFICADDGGGVYVAEVMRPTRSS